MTLIVIAYASVRNTNPTLLRIATRTTPASRIIGVARAGIGDANLPLLRVPPGTTISRWNYERVVCSA